MFGGSRDDDVHERCRAHELTLRENADDWRTAYFELLMRYEEQIDRSVVRETELLNRLGGIVVAPLQPLAPRVPRPPREASTAPAAGMPLVSRVGSPGVPGPRPLPRPMNRLTPEAMGFRPAMPMPRPQPRPPASMLHPAAATPDATAAAAAEALDPPQSSSSS